MRIVATSDIHGHLPEIPECDLLLVVGDVCPVENHDRQYQADWLRSDFKDWLTQVPAKNAVWTGGNHDFVLQDWGRTKRHKIDALGGTYLENEDTVIDGLKIWGSPYSNKYGGWAYMLPEGMLAEKWRTIPRDVDIIIVHGPPYGVGDGCGLVWDTRANGWIEEHVGSTSLLNQLTYDEWPNLKYIFFGHIHEGFGSYKLKNIDLFNVALRDEKYEHIRQPVVIDL